MQERGRPRTKPFGPKNITKPRELTPEIILSRVDKQEGNCWLWKGPTTKEGYGVISQGATSSIAAHRWFYQYFQEVIPEGLQLDHLCRVRNCVNPAHLEPVTAKENFLRSEAPTSILSRTNLCKRGHPFTPENTYWLKAGVRSCATCRKEYRERPDLQEKVKDYQHQYWINVRRNMPSRYVKIKYRETHQLKFDLDMGEYSYPE